MSKPRQGQETDVYQDFDVLVENADGTVRSYRPETFRLLARCQSTMLLDDCIERYNARMRGEGLNEVAKLFPRSKRRASSSPYR